MARRSVKQGNVFFLGMNEKWPVVLLQSDDLMYAWIAFRLTFNPLEIDLIKCNVVQCNEPNTEHKLRVDLRFVSVPNSNNILPDVDTMREFATWYSQQTSESWTCSLYLDYTLGEDRPVHFLLTEAYASSQVSAVSFEHIALEQKKERSSDRSKRTIVDEEMSSEDLSTVEKLMKGIGVKGGSASSKTTAAPKAKKINQLPISSTSACSSLALFIFYRRRLWICP